MVVGGCRPIARRATGQGEWYNMWEKRQDAEEGTI